MSIKVDKFLTKEGKVLTFPFFYWKGYDIMKKHMEESLWESKINLKNL